MSESTDKEPGTGSGTFPTPVSAAVEWLAHAQQEPRQAHREWADTGVALLPLGRHFEAARLPARLVLAAVDTYDPPEITERLTRFLNGPAFFDGRAMGGTFDILMRTHRTGHVWKYQDVAPRLGVGNYLAVPRMDRTKPPGAHWVVPPRFPGDLCEPATVEALIGFGLSITLETDQ
ncbi:hypothetical protein [Streptomyces sp. NPDC005898]|uniref:hypothetical protein n=1 Tax=Streptomyces sp. NPDC005898 TaxID=3157082 RepID=UPI0033E9BB10